MGMKIKLIMKNFCCLRLKSRDIEKYEYNKKFINSRLDVTKFIKLYDQINCLQSMLLEEDQSLCLSYLVDSLPGGFEHNRKNEVNSKILFDNIKLRKNAVDEKILSIFQNIDLKLE